MNESVSLSTFLLARYFYRILGYGMAGFSAAAVAARGMPDPWISLVSLAATGLGATATFVLNDYFDREVDKKIRPWRPLVSGKMKPRSALILASILISVGFLLTITLYNFICLLVALVALVAALIYNMSKRRRYIAHGILALNPALSIVYGYAAAAGVLSFELVPLALMMALILFTDSFSMTMVTSVPDVTGDEVGGAVTASVRLGAIRAMKLGLVLLMGNLALGVLPFMLGYLSIGYLVCFVTARMALFGMHVFFTKNPDRKMGLFIMGTQFFFRTYVCLSFVIGILPINLGLSLALLLCLIIIRTPINYYTYAFRLRKL